MLSFAADLLQPLTAKKEDTTPVVSLNILVRSKDQDAEHFKTLIAASAAVGESIGVLSKEKNAGDFIAAWTAALAASSLKQVDVANGLASVLAVKDESELVRQSSSSLSLFSPHHLAK